MKNYRIYINNNTLLVTDAMPKHVSKIEPLDTDGFDFLSFYKNLKKRSSKDFVLISKNPKELFETIKKKLTIIKAAGGLVENAKGEFLFIFRNKKWDLPKGKVEKNEKVKVAAVREVEEECGVKIEKRQERLCKTYHIYELNGKVILKRTSWYKMFVKGKPKLIPQTEEGITTASWVGPDGIKAKMNNTYPLILDVLAAESLV
ncbi:NUDIX hydrolase [Pedobacter frigiditerrae]|uniref:NUDIX hydrolase n=1 Tax=Pedobacter frigiditerrae TaxID=2530452 RepID=UPI00292CFE40|nr:NUDIX domain-containing protein [Pedobacter frigiditerrae]